MKRPGASSERNGAPLLNSETAFATVPKLPSSTEPTLTAEEMHAGADMALGVPSLPDAAIVAIPTDRSWSIIALRAPLLLSQVC